MKHKAGEAVFVAALVALAILDALTLPLRAAQLAARRARAWWDEL